MELGFNVRAFFHECNVYPFRSFLNLLGRTYAPSILLEMKKVKDKVIEKGKDFLSYYHYHKFDKKYDKLIEQAQKENPLPETTEKKTWPEEKRENPCPCRTPCELQGLSLPFYP